jgi:hypothetical protein
VSSSKPPPPPKYPIGGPGKPILEWEEVVLDQLLETLRERADKRIAAELKARNRLN